MKALKVRARRRAATSSSSKSSSSLEVKVKNTKWSDVEAQRALVESIGDALGITRGNLEGWYKVTSAKFIKSGGGGLLMSQHSGSIQSILSKVYPEHKWQGWLFAKTSRTFWRAPENQKAFLQYLAQLEGIDENKAESWYKIDSVKVLKNKGGGLLNHFHGGSLYSLLSKHYSHLNLLPWKFSGVPRNYWRDTRNQRLLVNSLAKKLGIDASNMENWYKLTTQDVVDHGGQALLRWYHNGSLLSLLSGVFPEHTWVPWKFTKTSKYESADISEQREILRAEVESRLGIKPGDFEAWYKITNKQFGSTGAGWLLDQQYGSSLYALLSAIYSEHEWLPWKFTKMSNVAMKDPEELLKVMTWVEQSLHFAKPEDWYRVTLAQLRDLGVHHFFKSAKGLIDVLKRVYPNVSWNLEHFNDTLMRRTYVQRSRALRKSEGMKTEDQVK